MADNLAISFSLTGLAQVLKGFKAVQQAALDTQKAVAGLSQGVVKAGSVQNQQGATFRQFIQAYALISKAQINALNANTAALNKFGRNGGGNGGGLGGNTGGPNRQTRQRQPPSFMRQLERFVRSSRFGAAGIQPLVGQGIDLLGAAGLGQAAGPLGVLSSAAFESGKALKKFADGAAETTARLSSLRYGTGSNLREAGKLQGLAGAIGLSSEDAAGVASGIDAASTSGGLGAAYASRAGIDIRPAPFGSTDRAKKALQALKYIANDKDENDATNFARQTGSEAFLPIRDLSPSARAEALRQAEASPLTQRQVTTGADYIAARNNFDQARNRFLARNAGPIERFGARALGYGAGVLGGARPIITAPSAGLSSGEAASYDGGLTREGDAPAYALATPRARAAFRRYQNRANGAMGGAQAIAAGQVLSNSGAVHTAMNALVKAVDANTRVQSRGALMPGTYGNASRGDFAGENQGGLALHKAIKADKAAFQLGAF